MTSIPHRYTIAEYFRMEENAVEKHEYDDGRIFSMAGGTGDHSAIIANTIIAIGVAIDGTNCRLFDSNLRLGLEKTAKFVYPDIQIVCGTVEYDPRDVSRGTILNPKIVIEVLSPFTAAYDRGHKFDFYRNVESMHEYVLISQLEPRVERFLRKGKGEWAFVPAKGLTADLNLASLDISIALAAIYKNILFPLTGADGLDD